jgi:hypothetical protein
VENERTAGWLWKSQRKSRTSLTEEKIDFSSIGARPTTESLLIYKNLTYTPWFALGEFVDNSITSFVKQVREEPSNPEFLKLAVAIWWDEAREILTILDNAAGIPATREGWGRALEVGSRNPDPSVLGVYGYGMKAAGLWWSPSMEIESKFYRDSVVRSVNFDPEQLVRSRQDSVPLLTSVADNIDDHWTKVTLKGLNPGRSYPTRRGLGRVREFLSSMYRHYLRGNFGLIHPETGLPFVEIKVQGDVLEFREPELLTSVPWTSSGPEKTATEITWRKDFVLEIPSTEVVDGKQLVREISGWVGILAKFSRSNAGLFLSFHGKGIFGVAQGTSEDSPDQYRPQKLFGTSSSFKIGRLVGEIDVSDYGKSATTDSASWSEEEETILLHELEKLLKTEPNILSMAEKFRATSAKELTPQQRKSHQEEVNKTSEEAQVIIDALGESPVDVPQKVSKAPEPVGKVFSAEKPFKLASGHSAIFETTFGKETDDWLSIYPDPEKITRIVVNNNHPYIRRHFPPENSGKSIWQLAIAIATAELDNPRISEFRMELNRWLELSGHYDFLDRKDDPDE